MRARRAPRKFNAVITVRSPCHQPAAVSVQSILGRRRGEERDSSDIDESAKGVSVGDGAMCVGASLVDDAVYTSSRITPPSDAMSDFEVKFIARAAIRLERGCLLGIEPRAVKLTPEAWAQPASFLRGSPLFARLSDCPCTVKVRALSDGLGGGEKRVTPKLENAKVAK